MAAKKKNDALEKALKIKAESRKATFMAAAGIDENETDEIIEEKFEEKKVEKILENTAPAVEEKTAETVSVEEAAEAGKENEKEMKKEEKRTKKVLLATPEATPFAHSGGLGEVASSMPISIMNNADSNVDIRVIMPLYAQVGEYFREKMTYLGNTYVNLAWRSQYAGLLELKHENVTLYFIDNEYYFK